MKRFFVSLAALLALSLPTTVTAAKSPDVVKGPACGDIDLAVDYTYDTPGANSGPATLSGALTTKAPSCKKGVYVVYVYDGSGTTQLASCTYTGDGVATSFAPCTYASADGAALCVYATSQTNDGHFIDVAPNDGCASFGEPIVPGPSGATGFH